MRGCSSKCQWNDSPAARRAGGTRCNHRLHGGRSSPPPTACSHRCIAAARALASACKKSDWQSRGISQVSNGSFGGSGARATNCSVATTTRCSVSADASVAHVRHRPWRRCCSRSSSRRGGSSGRPITWLWLCAIEAPARAPTFLNKKAQVTPSFASIARIRRCHTVIAACHVPTSRSHGCSWWAAPFGNHLVMVGRRIQIGESAHFPAGLICVCIRAARRINFGWRVGFVASAKWAALVVCFATGVHRSLLALWRHKNRTAGRWVDNGARFGFVHWLAPSAS